jgi:hypothetical protein
MGQEQAIGLTRTGNIYAIQEADNDTKGYIFHQDTVYVGVHVGKMRTDELWDWSDAEDTKVPESM